LTGATGLFLVQGVPAWIIYGLMLLIFRPGAKPSAREPQMERWERGLKIIAIRSPSLFSYFPSILYITLYYWSVPALVWRYGFLTALVVIAVPLAAGLTTALCFGASGDNPLALSLLGAAPVRALAAYWIGARDGDLHRRTLKRRGWSRIAETSTD
jgi:hypothetical protein